MSTRQQIEVVTKLVEELKKLKKNLQIGRDNLSEEELQRIEELYEEVRTNNEIVAVHTQDVAGQYTPPHFTDIEW